MIRRRRRRRWRIRVLPVAHDHVERWQPTAPPASWRQLAAANIAATQRILRMRHVAMLPSCHVAKLLSVPQFMLPAVCVFIHKNRHSPNVCVCGLLQHCWGTSESSRLPLFISKCSAIKFYSRKCTLKPSDSLCSLCIFVRANEFNVYCEFFHSFSFPVFSVLFRLQVSGHTLYYWHLLMTAARQSLLLCSRFFLFFLYI